MADGDRTNLGNFPDDFDDDEQDALEAAPETPESEAPVAPPDGPPAEPPAGDTPGVPPSSPAPAAASADELAQLRQEIAFLRQGQVPAAPTPAAAPQPPDVLGMIDNYLGSYKPTAAEVAEAQADPEKMAALIYNAARVATGAGAALGLQAAQAQAAQQASQQQMYQARGEAFRAAYPQLQKYGTVVQHHAGQVHAELTARGQQVPPQTFAAEVARRASADLKQNFGIDPDAQPRKQRLRPATAERGTSATNGVAPRAKGGRRQDQIGKFLGLH